MVSSYGLEGFWFGGFGFRAMLKYHGCASNRNPSKCPKNPGF